MERFCCGYTFSTIDSLNSLTWNLHHICEIIMITCHAPKETENPEVNNILKVFVTIHKTCGFLTLGNCCYSKYSNHYTYANQRPHIAKSIYQKTEKNKQHLHCILLWNPIFAYLPIAERDRPRVFWLNQICPTYIHTKFTNKWSHLEHFFGKKLWLYRTNIDKVYGNIHARYTNKLPKVENTKQSTHLYDI